MQVRINGEEAPIRGEALSRMTDVVELIKANIDPDHIITHITLDGRELSDSDWHARPSSFGGTVIVEVHTGTAADFVADRMSRAPEALRSMMYTFTEARKAFQTGNSTEGNRLLVSAVRTAKAFFEWYDSMIQLMPPERRAAYDISVSVRELSGICQNIVQQQLYHSWWAIGETIEKQLEPKLVALEKFCQSF